MNARRFALLSTVSRQTIVRFWRAQNDHLAALLAYGKGTVEP